jgi:hypothetical protein
MSDESENVDWDDDKVCVVAASSAWPFYQLTGAYICQENRFFQPDTGRFGFYSSRSIHGIAAQVEGYFPSVEFSEESAAEYALSSNPQLRRVGEALDAAFYQEWGGDPFVQVVLLTPMGHVDTVAFPAIRHDGQTAWTMKQRYVSLRRLQAASSTADLKDPEEVP